MGVPELVFHNISVKEQLPYSLVRFSRFWFLSFTSSQISSREMPNEPAKPKQSHGTQIFESVCSFLRKSIFRVLLVGPIPNHVSFIMDGNRRYERKNNLKEGEGHRLGFLALMPMLKYCYEMGVKYISIYAFSIDNFKRRPEEVQCLMELMQDKIERLLEEESIVNEFGIRVCFIGNLQLLCEPVRVAAEEAMKATAKNTMAVLLICVAYASTDEIVHAVQEACHSKSEEVQVTRDTGEVEECEKSKGRRQPEQQIIKLPDIERQMYMAVAPDPDIVVRSAGANRLSNFVLWQTRNCLLYSPSALWPELGLRHLVWVVLNFQRHYRYLDMKKKQP